jgi:hypothetical protein
LPQATAARRYPGAVPRPRLLALLFVAGAAISAFTVLRGIDPFDEGVMLQAAHRIADGQLPYRDFFWPYGPGHPYLLAALDRLLGESLLWWRVVRVLCDAGVALLLFVLARRLVPTGWALAAWLCAACAMAQPVSANPFPVALLSGLAALAVASSRRRRWWLWAGVLVGLTAVWRLDFGGYAGISVLAAAFVSDETSVRMRGTSALRFAAVATATAAALYAPFAIAAGVGDVYDQLVATAVRERGHWTLPFPWSYGGPLRSWPPRSLLEDLKDMLGFYVPALILLGTAVAVAGAVLLRRHRTAPATWSATAFAAALVLYLLPRPDEFHANPSIVLLGLLLPATAMALWRADDARRALALAAAAVFVLLTAYGVANRVSALLQPPDLEPLELAIADGVEARPADAAALPAVVRAVQRKVPAGEPIYVATRRSDLVAFNDPLLYVLADRPSVLDRDAGLFARPAEQRKIVAALRHARPRAIVRWTDPLSVRREPNLRGEPTGRRIVDRYLAARYRLALERGRYEVLTRR